MSDDDESDDGTRSPLRVGRAVAGVLVIGVVLVLILGETFTQARISPGRIPLLVALAGALLGFDLLLDRLPVSITIEDTNKNETTENDE